MRLLLCEDEKTLSKVIKVLLTSNNYSVDTVFDGEEALDYIRTNIYDGIILDLMMPKINGIDVLKKIRSEGIKTPILILTAKAEIDDKVFFDVDKVADFQDEITMEIVDIGMDNEDTVNVLGREMYFIYDTLLEQKRKSM